MVYDDIVEAHLRMPKSTYFKVYVLLDYMTKKGEIWEFTLNPIDKSVVELVFTTNQDTLNIFMEVTKRFA